MEIDAAKMVESYKSLPQPIRAFLSDPSFGENIKSIGEKFSLHIDVQGAIGKLVTYILLGFLPPTNLRAELLQAGVTEAQVPNIIKELNTRIFESLQKSMREGSVETFDSENPESKSSSNPATPFASAAPIPLRPKLVQPAPAAVSPPAPAPAPTNPAPAPTNPAPTLAVPQPFAPPPVSMPATPAEHPAIRTMAHDMEAIREESKHPHEAFPAPKPHPAPVAPPAWQPASPARTFQTSSVPNTAQVRPFAPSPAPMPAPATPPMPPVPPRTAAAVPFPPNLPGQPANTHPSSTPPIVKEYSVDPYREMPE